MENKKKNWAGGKYHWFEEFFNDFLCLSQPHINNVSRQISLDQDVQWIIQVLIAWSSPQLVFLEIENHGKH